MVSFSQLLVLLLILIFLFGDIRKIYHQLLVIFFNIKNFLKKTTNSSKKKD